ncbi:MAG: transglutaminase domain-containing protein [Deltaproteobacteria bacterium]|nr:transglutaminase domain-containing protein [Deltaproteobacteria bacterium]
MNIPEIPVRQIPYNMSRGMKGTKITLAHMALVMWKTSHSTRLARFARDVISRAKIREYDQLGEITALFSWVRRNVRYTRDPQNHEWLQTPLVTVLFGHGDCDCQAMLLGTLLMSIGYPVRIVIVGNAPDQFFHVFLAARYRKDGQDQWIDLDPTVADGLGLKRIFAARREFDVLEQGALKETSTAPAYGLGNFLGDLFAGPPKVISMKVGSKEIRVPWSVRDIPYVSDAEWDNWFRQLKETLTPEEILQVEAGFDRLEQAGALSNKSPELSGLWDKVKKGLKKVAAPLAVVAAPITGGASIAALAAYKGGKAMAGKKAAAPGRASKAPRTPKAPKARAEVKADTPDAIPAVKAEAGRNYLLMGGGLAAAGGLAYVATRDS